MEKDEVIHVRVPADLKAALVAYCKRLEMPLGMVIRHVIREELANEAGVFLKPRIDPDAVMTLGKDGKVVLATRKPSRKGT